MRPWLRRARSQRGGEVRRRVGDLHAASATAGRGFHQHRVADVARDRDRVLVGLDAAIGAGHDRDAELGGGTLGLDLVAHQADVLGLGADEMDAVLGQDLGEAGVFRQKAVAGVHRVGAGDLAGREQRRDVKVGFARRRRADAHALVGEANVHGVGIGG